MPCQCKKKSLSANTGRNLAGPYAIMAYRGVSPARIKPGSISCDRMVASAAIHEIGRRVASATRKRRDSYAPSSPRKTKPRRSPATGQTQHWNLERIQAFVNSKLRCSQDFRPRQSARRLWVGRTCCRLCSGPHHCLDLLGWAAYIDGRFGAACLVTGRVVSAGVWSFGGGVFGCGGPSRTRSVSASSWVWPQSPAARICGVQRALTMTGGRP